MKFVTHRFRISKPTANPGTEVDPLGSIALRTCDRCKRLKKRCNRKLPKCDSCVASGQSCNLVQQATTSAASPKQLQAKIDYLKKYIEENLPPAGIEEAETLFDDPETHRISSTPGSVSAFNTATRSTLPRHDASQSSPGANDTDDCESLASHSTALDPPYLAFAKAYFRHVHRAYPFLDKHQVLKRANPSSNLDLWRQDPESTKFCLVMAIGSTTLERAGKISSVTRMNIEVPYADILSHCIASPSINSLQILTLLALYSLFDPKGIATWSIVGVLTRQAATLGLARMSSNSDDLSSYDGELRHRLFWSIFVLDRMLAVSVGQPVGFVEENMDVPQPAITVNEFGSPDRVELASLLQLNRHIIRLRQLEQKILAVVHLPNSAKISNMASTDRKTIAEQLRSEVDHWYSQGCLVSLPETDNIPIHNTITWLNARYYNLLILLYYPCHFNSQSRHTSGEQLLAFIQKYVHYNQILLVNRQLPLNHITLNRFIPVCLSLLYCFGSSSPRTFSGRADLTTIANILREFPSTWRAAHRTANVMDEFAELVAGHEGYSSTLLVHPTFADNVPLQPTTRAWLQTLQKNLSQILSEILGSASCYLYMDDWDKAQTKPDFSLELVGQSTSRPQGLDANSWTLADNFDPGFL